MSVSKSEIQTLWINKNDFTKVKRNEQKEKWQLNKYFCTSQASSFRKIILQHYAILAKELKLFSLYTNSTNIR